MQRYEKCVKSKLYENLKMLNSVTYQNHWKEIQSLIKLWTKSSKNDLRLCLKLLIAIQMD